MNRKDLLDSLAKTPFDRPSDELTPEIFQGAFFPVAEHGRVLDVDLGLVLGESGSGKSWLLNAVLNPAWRQDLLGRFERQIPNPHATLQSDWLLASKSVAGFALENLPGAVQGVGAQLITELTGAGPKAVLDFCQQQEIPDNKSNFVGWLDALDLYLREQERWIVICYDNLQDWPEIALAGLFQFWGDTGRRWRRLRPKIFVQPHLYNLHRKTLGAPVTFLGAHQLEMVWNEKNLYAAWIKQLANASEEWFDFCKENNISFRKYPLWGWLPQIEQPEDVETLLQRLFGAYLDAGQAKGRTLHRLAKIIADLNSDMNPGAGPGQFGELIRSGARIELTRPQAGPDRLIHPLSLQQAKSQKTVVEETEPVVLELKGAGLTQQEKRRIKSLILELRHLLEEDLERELRRLGLDPLKSEPILLEKLAYLSEAEQQVRQALDAAVQKERQTEGSYPSAVRAVLREAAYTHLNRLVGLKCIELRGHLALGGEPTEAVTSRPEFGDRPKWLWTLRSRETRYRSGEDAEELLWRAGLEQAYAAVTAEIGILFDPADPYAQAWPSHYALRKAVDRLNDLPEIIFKETDELLGWVYQYFQSEEKDRVFEDTRVKGEKISGKDIVPVTQLYTERYMVDFLLQNSLGARWMEMYPDSNAKAAWPYYVTPASPHTRPPKPLKEWKLLDPCVGSGHFHVVAFDLFVPLYAEERKMEQAGRLPKGWSVPETDVARVIIENNLHGIDIDPRAVQIAALALYLKYKDYTRTHPALQSQPPRFNLVAADAVLSRGPAYQTLLAQYTDDPAAREAIEAIWRALEHVRDLGSLVRVEEEVDAAVRKAQKGSLPLFDQGRDWEAYKRTLIARLKDAFAAESRSHDINERLFGDEARKGLGLVELLSQRYDVVCTNPPYMGSGNMGEVLRNFVTKYYPAGKQDLFSSFIIRCRELALVEGHVSMVTQITWMFMRNFSELRIKRIKKSREQGDEFSGMLQSTRISTMAHLGEHGFSDPGAAGAFVVLFAFVKEKPASNHRISAFRLIGPKSPEEKSSLLLSAIKGHSTSVKSTPRQNDFLGIPDGSMPYWLPEKLLGFLSSKETPKFSEFAFVAHGLGTRCDQVVVRYSWEINPGTDYYYPYSKGGGYGRWFGRNYFVVNFAHNGEYIRQYQNSRYPYLKGNLSRLVADESYYYLPGLCYSEVGRGSLGVRVLPENSIPGHRGPGIYPDKFDLAVVAAYLNSRINSYLYRALNPSTLLLDYSYFSSLPVAHKAFNVLSEIGIGDFCIALKTTLVNKDLTELSFFDCIGAISDCILSTNMIESVLHSAEGYNERLVTTSFALDDDITAILEETGTPAGWYPLVSGYDALPEFPNGLPPIPTSLSEHLISLLRVTPGAKDLMRLKNRLRTLYIAGPGAKDEGSEQEEIAEVSDSSEEESVLGAHIPIPAETFLEELSQRLEIHPISVYWLLEELRREEGLVCPPEVQRHTEDYFSVKLLRMLGHRWPLQDQYEQDQGQPFLDPQWVDEDGIIPLTAGSGEPTLIERMQRYLDAEFGAEHGADVEREASMILGWKPGDEWGKQKPLTLSGWFERAFFKRHVSQFKRRPIAWHLSSPKGAFQAIVYYHKFDHNCLTLLRARYVRETLDDLRKKLGTAQAESLINQRQALGDMADLEKKIADVQAFDENLRRLLEGREREARIWTPWKSAEEQPVGWNPDINDGVRVNIAPLQRLGLLAAPALAEKDVRSLLAPRGR